MLILELKKRNSQNQTHIFQYTNFESSQIHQLRIMQHFETTNRDILLNALFQNLFKLFLRVHNLHPYYPPYLCDFKNLLFQVMMFH